VLEHDCSSPVGKGNKPTVHMWSDFGHCTSIVAQAVSPKTKRGCPFTLEFGDGADDEPGRLHIITVDVERLMAPPQDLDSDVRMNMIAQAQSAKEINLLYICALTSAIA